MLKNLFLLFILLPFSCFAQYTITGKIINSVDKTPVANASVFFNNAVAGTKTDDKGVFILTNARRGQYDLVISCVGFETAHHAIMVSADMKLADIGLNPKIMQLQEVRIKPNSDWEKNYAMFKKMFFGTSDYASQCKILNSDELDLDYDSKKAVFTAKSYDYLEIENKALGYKIRYMLNDLKNDFASGMYYYEGVAAFEELKGTPSQHKRWQKNRLNAYLGSSMHFLRSTIANTLPDEGFTVFRLIRKLNPNYSGGLNDKYKQTLVNTPLQVNDIVKRTDIEGEFALTYDDFLYITYSKKKVKHLEKSNGEEIKVPSFINDDLKVTIIDFNEKYAFYDNNGVFINPRSITFEGNWGTRLMAELLPVDYVPNINE